MKTLYLDLVSGISGDMFIGALLDLGVPPAKLEEELEKLGLGGYHLHISRGQKSTIAGVKFDVHVEDEHEHGHHHPHDHSHEHEHVHGEEHGHSHQHTHEHAHGGHTHSHLHSHEHGRDFAQIRELINRSALSPWVKEKSVAVFQRIAVAEGKIHGVPANQVAFHEVGAVDSIVDIVGGCIALELLGSPRVLASVPVEGTGWIDCAHGRFPVPAPATLEILSAKRVPLTQCDEPHELITPTGAALLAEFAESFGPMQHLAAEKIGFGLGTRDNNSRPNVLRAILGETVGPKGSAPDWETDTVAVLETNLDDISPEILGHFVGKALDRGALDVFYTAVQMKKNRPGMLLTVLCAEADAARFSELILRETSAFGVRRYLAERRKLVRRSVMVRTDYGEVSVKLGTLDGVVIQAAPEFESCRKLASEKGVPLKEVYEAAARVARGPR
jgi:uncharacterized protein (TIGR00299 family) protein